MKIRYRRATPDDIRCSRRLAEPDRALMSGACWANLPELLEDLWMRERILLCVFEDIDAGRLISMGGTAFLRPEFLSRAVAANAGILGPALDEEARGRPALLNQKQVAESNRQQDLRILNFFGRPIGIDLSKPERFEILGTWTEAWNFFHKGFGLREIWRDSTDPDMTKILIRIGFRPFQPRALPSGKPAMLLQFTREMAVESTPSWPASAMFAMRPRFGFSKGERQLLEAALLDCSDRDAARQLGLSAEAMKKRWRSIYSKVSRVDRELLPSDVAGADRRRLLLQTLRNNLQELRPY